MKKEKVQRVLANACNAIRDGNHEKLYQVIAEITDGLLTSQHQATHSSSSSMAAK